jgi:hypothetical protein
LFVVFVDQIVLTQSFSRREFPEGIPEIAGLRRLAWREPGDIAKQGHTQKDMELVSESQSAAWLHGSHETRLQIKSDGKTLLLAGNVGRFGAADNIFNLDLDATIAKANRIAEEQGFPAGAFFGGDPADYTDFNVDSVARIGKADAATEARFTGSRVWSIHMTQNYITGSPLNLKQAMKYISTQSMPRVTKKRRGESTIEFGQVSYCQTQLYDKAAEILAHTSKDERKFLQSMMTEAEEEKWVDSLALAETERLALYRKRKAWQYAHDNGLLRVEVKCNKDFLVHKGLTYLGAWNMGKVIEIFAERTKVLDTLKIEIDAEMDIESLPKNIQTEAAAWLAGVDVRALLPRSTYFRKAKVLREYGIDISEPRQIGVVRPIMKEIEIRPATAPQWYQMVA